MCRASTRSSLVLTALLAAGSFLADLTVATAPAAAQQLRYMSCGQLWYARNAIYARRGYCFQSARARAVFGARCYPPYGKLRAWESRRVSRIRRWERRKGC